MKIPFIKAHGAGNDFIIIDKNVDIIKKSKKMIKKLCDRRFGIGCDQLILLKKYPSYHRVYFYNSDGSLGKNCGNGLRCVYKYLSETKKYKKVVIKPIDSYSGNDVMLLINFNKTKIKKLIKRYNHLMFQKFIPQISKGDKRVFIINDKIKGAISRLPKSGSILSNMSKGASAKKIKLSKQETKISRIVANELKKKNIYFAGIDFIKGKLIGDINVTSPTGLKTYFDLTGINLAKYFFDNIK